jgi:serine/threonine protein phosphatase PrpC
MKHMSQPPSRLLRPFLIALCLALGFFVALDSSADAASQLRSSSPLALVPLASSPTASPAATNTTAPQATATPVPQATGKGVDLAELATVRVVVTYSFTLQNTPLTRQCSGLGVLVQSTDPTGKQGSPYLLTTNQVLSKQLCPEAAQNLPGPIPSVVPITSIAVRLSTAYSEQAIQFTIKSDDPAIAADRKQPLLVLAPLISPANTSHDYPTATLSKQGSASSEAQLDLTGAGNDPTTHLTPVALATPFPASDQVSAGAPMIDTQTGDVLALNSPGGTPLTVVGTNLSDLPGAAASCPQVSTEATPCLSTQWARVLDARASNDTATERTLLQTITSKYTDFTAAKNRLSALPAASPVTSPVASPTPGNSGFLGLGQTEIFIALGVLVVLLLAVFSMTFLIYFQRLRKRQKREQAAGHDAAEQRATPFMPRTPSGQMAPAGFAASSSGGAPQVAPGAPTLPYAPSVQSMAQGGRTVTCANCGAQNNAGSSVCANCGNDLMQAPGAMSGARGAFPPSTSGGPARLNLPSLSQPPVSLPPIPAAPDLAAQPPQSYGNNVMAPYQGENQETEPSLQALSRNNEERTVVLPGRKRPAFGVIVSSRTDRGRKRASKENEDNYLAVTGTRMLNGQTEPFGLFVVADGMGGHANGQEASRMTIESIFLDLAPRLTQQEVPDDELTALLQQAVQSANQKLYRQNQQDHSDMGCTMTAALVAGDEAHICNVGDSRTYLLKPGSELQRITVDHSIVESLVAAGVIQKDDVYTHPKRNQIYRSLGEKEVIEIDAFRQRVAPGDKLLLCCDGLWEMIRDNEIEMILSQNEDLPQASAKLIEMANEHGGVDNITAIVVKVTEQKKPARRPGIESVDSGPSKLPSKRTGG